MSTEPTTNPRAPQSALQTIPRVPPPVHQRRPDCVSYPPLAGAALGLAGAVVSLLFNVVGAAIAGLHPLQLVRVYLTFPLGSPALLANNPVASGWVALTVGCGLYLLTGAVFGVILVALLNRRFMREAFIHRALFTTWFAVVLWFVNFKLVLSWLQPLLFDRRWIVDEVPWTVGVATHLAYCWTILLLLPLVKPRATP
jgi:hypothetical protein